jgi:transcriptional regulator with XRE-family HTH domain
MQRIIAYMDENSLTQNALANEIGIGQSTVSTYFCGRDPSVRFIELILDRYKDLSAEWLLRGEEPMLKMTITPCGVATHNERPEAGYEKLYNEIMREKELYQKLLEKFVGME